jgi:hypothetical protein
MRVVPGNGRGIGVIKRKYEHEPRSAVSSYIYVCAGGIDDGDGPHSIVRGKRAPTLVRASESTLPWATDAMAQSMLEGA